MYTRATLNTKLVDSPIRTTTPKAKGTDEPVRIGECHRRSTLYKNFDPGIAPSRLKAYIMREFDVTEKVLHKREHREIL
jgi:hypothetical protein